MKTLRFALLLAVSLILSGCGSMLSPRTEKQNASVVDYLYPDAKDPPRMQAEVTRLKLPVKVGIAFVPSAAGWGANTQLSETEKLKLLERVKSAFARHDYIGKIEIVPTTYLRAKGGFANLEQVARMFDVEVMALVSYDQVQFNDNNNLSLLYWTIVGMYLVQGDRYDVQTLMDASVFDVASRKLLFRAPGTSRVKGSATVSGFTEQSRAARVKGYEEATGEMIPALQAQLDAFKDRVKGDASVKVETRPEYRGGGALGAGEALLAFVGLGAWAWRARRRRG